VYVLPGSPRTFEQRVWIGSLAAGPHAVVSHETAAELHRIPNVVRDRVTLIVPHGGHHRIAGAIVHQISDLLDHHICNVRGFTATSIPRTIVDLAPRVSPLRLQSIIEDSKFANLTTPVAVGLCLADVARRGKPGVQRLARVLDLFGDGKATSNSKLEDAVTDLIRAAGLPTPTRQFPFPGRQFVKGCVDFAYVGEKLVIEADGRKWHARTQDIRRDHERDGDAAEQGWQTLRLLYEHIVGDPDGTARRIRAVLAQRRAQLAS
jgi:very-short-patch-repair endonuclease